MLDTCKLSEPTVYKLAQGWGSKHIPGNRGALLWQPCTKTKAQPPGTPCEGVGPSVRTQRLAQANPH